MRPVEENESKESYNSDRLGNGSLKLHEATDAPKRVCENRSSPLCLPDLIRTGFVYNARLRQ